MTRQKTAEKKAQNPLILRSHRLMEAFAKSDDERDFYLDRLEGFLVYVDLNKSQEELDTLEREIQSHPNRYALVPKLTFYEVKKIMESFINEKVYDIDTKEKLLDIIEAREAREKFLEFIYDNLMELEKWQQYYQERFRVRIIEWLRELNVRFVFEEDLDFNSNLIEKLKETLFEEKVPKEIAAARKTLDAKAKTYYSNEALNPRPKRGRPPKQATKVEIEPQISRDIYTTVPSCARPFLFTPDISSASSVTFSAKFDSGEELMASLRNQGRTDVDNTIESLNQKLASIRELSNHWYGAEGKPVIDFSQPDDDEEADEAAGGDEAEGAKGRKTKRAPAAAKKKAPVARKKAAPTKKS